VTFIFDFVLIKFHYQLYARYGTGYIHQVRDLLVGYVIALLQPEKVEVLEFRQEVFTVELVVIQKMLKRIPGFVVFVDAEKVLPLSLCELDLELMVAAKIEAEAVVEVQDQLVVFDRRDNTDKARVLEEPLGHILYVKFEFHGVKASRPLALAPSIRE
jgi:hypothetical protein